MTWTAELIDAEDRETHWFVEIEFTDGVKTIRKGYPFNGTTPQELAAFVRGKAADFERTDTTTDFSTLIGQSIDVTPPTPPAPTPPTQAELDRAAWFADYRELQQMLQATTDIPALATAQATTAIANLRTSLEAGWLNSYLDGIR